MTTDRIARPWTTIVLDIEGTTTRLAFVHDVLFPYARGRLASYLSAHRHDLDVVDAGVRLRGEHEADRHAGQEPPAWPGGDDAGLVAYLEFLMDRDRKSPGLKALQGLIWEEGYRRGELHGEVFENVAPAMHRWRAAGKRIAIYSSGSVLAQRLLFSTTPAGDLTTIIDGFFDTGVGAKTEAASYGRIASTLGAPPSDLLFLSDAPAEVTAAEAAGLQALLVTDPAIFDRL